MRTTIGQVHDYVHVAQQHGIAPRPVILLPGNPTEQLQELLQNLGIALAVESEDGGLVVYEA